MSVNQKFADIDWQNLEFEGISADIVYQYLPKFIIEQSLIDVSKKKLWFFGIYKKLLELSALWMLKPRKEIPGKLEAEEVEAVYTQEAKNYDKKHHLTTRGMDLIWRREVGFVVAELALFQQKRLRVLDLCTGTGLNIIEMSKIATMFNLEMDFVALDYCDEMLKIAQNNLQKEKVKNVKVVRGDATALINPPSSAFQSFTPKSFDVISLMFGIGGIADSLACLREALALLKNNGLLIIIDMHKPIFQLPGEWPLFFKWLRMPEFEIFCYEELTIPLALKRLWAWRDTTPVFYYSRLITEELENKKTFGFDVSYFNYRSMHWWGGLPLMPVAKIILRKTEISNNQAFVRETILSSLSFY